MYGANPQKCSHKPYHLLYLSGLHVVHYIWDSGKTLSGLSLVQSQYEMNRESQKLSAKSYGVSLVDLLLLLLEVLFRHVIRDYTHV